MTNNFLASFNNDKLKTLYQDTLEKSKKEKSLLSMLRTLGEEMQARKIKT